MMNVPWKDVLSDIKSTLEGYSCKVNKEKLSENRDGSVFCDYRVSFPNPDKIADWDEIYTKLARDDKNWGWRVVQEGLSFLIGIVFQK